MARLGTEGFELAGSALHPEQDAGLALTAQLVGFQPQRIAQESEPAAMAAADKPRKKSRRWIAPRRSIAASI